MKYLILFILACLYTGFWLIIYTFKFILRFLWDFKIIKWRDVLNNHGRCYKYTYDSFGNVIRHRTPIDFKCDKNIIYTFKRSLKFEDL